MNDNFEKDARKVLEQGITVFEGKIEGFVNKNKKILASAKAGKSIRYLFYDAHSGYMKVQYKYAYTPEEIELLEKARGLSHEKLQLLKEYIESLLID